jgi:hypothetical protein
MDENSTNPLVISLEKEINRRKISLKKFEEQTGISADKVAKWFQRGIKKLDSADAAIIKDWMDGQLSKKAESEESRYMTQIETLIKANAGLVEAAQKMADSHYIIAQSNRELVLEVRSLNSGKLAGEKNGPPQVATSQPFESFSDIKARTGTPQDKGVKKDK